MKRFLLVVWRVVLMLACSHTVYMIAFTPGRVAMYVYRICTGLLLFALMVDQLEALAKMYANRLRRLASEAAAKRVFENWQREIAKGRRFP